MGIRKILKYFYSRDVSFKSYKAACKCDVKFLTELEKFIQSARNILSWIETGNGVESIYVMRLQNLKAHDDPCAKRLKQKAECLQKQRRKMMEKLNSQFKKMGRKMRISSGVAWTLRLVTNMLFIGVVAAQFVCAIVAVVMATPLLAATFSAAIIPTMAARYWIVSNFIQDESSLDAQDNVIRKMQSVTGVADLKLGDIQIRIDEIMKVIDQLLSPDREEGDIVDFQRSIKKLEEKINEWNSMISSKAEDCGV